MASRSSEDADKKSSKLSWNPIEIMQDNRIEAGAIGVGTETGSEGLANDKTLVKKCLTDHPIEFIDVKVLGTWNIEHICKAGKLLRKPPIPVTFENQHEMRKVYSLIYDVFRYKHVLIEALKNIGFYAHYPKLQNDETRVWLMLFELYVRHFLKRASDEIQHEQKLYTEAQIDFIAKCLWTHRIRLAAAISRLRIKNGALHLSQLLPVHLQDEKVAIAAANPIVSGWLNPFKLQDKNTIMEQLKKIGLIEIAEDKNGDKPLEQNQFKWDKVCPLCLNCLPPDRNEFANSDFVQNHLFVMQDRTFSLAPAVFSKLVEHFQLTGDVIQTHITSPRSIAYLAALIHSINRINNFLVFGAGDCLEAYNNYMKTLNINNVRLFAENFSSMPLDTPLFDRVIGIFATPPNSFSGVADPIDLICSRGGDLDMLKILTESELSQDGRERVGTILEEQRETLRLAMSRPQIQFILYETHSIIGSENQDMIDKAVEDMNRYVYEKHLTTYKERKHLDQQQQPEMNDKDNPIIAATISPRKRILTASAKSDESGGMKIPLDKDTMGSSKESDISTTTTTTTAGIENNPDDNIIINLKIPKTDEFQVTEVPDMCLNQDKCIDFNSMGCYVALIQRKQITKLDAKYLIKMAETRGLFGSTDQKKTSAKPKSSTRKFEKKIDKTKEHETVTKKFLKKDEIDNLVKRLNQPTFSSLSRSNVPKLSSVTNDAINYSVLQKTCNRHSRYHGHEYACGSSPSIIPTLQLDTRAKRWWKETTNYVNQIRALEKQRTIKNNNNNNSNVHNNQKNEKDASIKDLSEYRKLLPPFVLSREYPKVFHHHHHHHHHQSMRYEKSQSAIRVPYPVTVRQLEFKGFGLAAQNKIAGSRSFHNLFLHSHSDENTLRRPSITSPKPLGHPLKKKT